MILRSAGVAFTYPSEVSGWSRPAYDKAICLLRRVGVSGTCACRSQANVTWVEQVRLIDMRMWQTLGTEFVERHIHAQAYVSVVLTGEYEEAGDLGRFCLKAGDVLFHDRFEAHVDRFTFAGARVLNLPAPKSHAGSIGPRRIDDLDRIVRLAELSARDASEAVDALAVSHQAAVSDWPDELARELIAKPRVSLGAWCEARKLKPWHVSRGFTQVFSVTPQAYRARARARKAWKECEGTRENLADIAARCGFADQAHMTRQLRELTGRTPHGWRSVGLLSSRGTSC